MKTGRHKYPSSGKSEFSAFILLVLLAASTLRAADTKLPREFAGAMPLQWSVRMADSEMARRGDSAAWKTNGTAKWDYTVGLFTLSLIKLDEHAPGHGYTAFAEKAFGPLIADDGKIQGYKADEYTLDNINPGKTVLALYQLTHEPRYKKAADLLRQQLDTQPRTAEGGFWHKQRYPHQMWLDGLYMAAPFEAQYATMFKEPSPLTPLLSDGKAEQRSAVQAAFDDVANQIRLVAAHTYDPATGLFYHGWDESKEQAWANKTTGTSSNFWGRAIGWYGMAMVDVLDYFPENHPARPNIIATLQKLCAGVVKHQDPASGLWYQIVDQPGRKGNYLEATASSMFVYTLAKAIGRGYISRDNAPAAVKGYQGIIRELIKSEANGRVSLTHCCSVAGLGYGRDGSYEYYLKEPVVNNDLKGVGPFILAGIELQKLLGLPEQATLPHDAAYRSHSGAPPRRYTDQADEDRPELLRHEPVLLTSAKINKTSIAPEWSEVPKILARIKPPQFPARQFSIRQFGAAGNGQTDCTEAIHKAIEACHEAGGGRVEVPAGEFLTGAIRLKSNVELHLVAGATLKFKTDPAAYLPVVFTRFEGMECYNYSPLIYAFEEENVAVTGEGTLDGQANNDNWWAWKGRRTVEPGTPNQKPARDRLGRMVDQRTPVKERQFGQGSFLRPSFIEPNRCRNVLIEGVHIRNSPMWELHPCLCTNVTVRGVEILSHGPNNDGCDPECSRDVLIENCIFDTGDDCIAIKSGRNEDGRRVGLASENLIIRHCTMKDGHGGVVVGSEISGGCRNVFAEDCQMDSPQLERVLRLKSNAMRGGVIENIFMRDVTVGRVADAVLQIDFLYEEGAKGPYPPVARNIVMEGISVNHTPRVLNVAGFPGAQISAVRIYNSTFLEVQKPDSILDASDIKLVDCATAAKGASEWQTLFNGSDLAGWVPVNGPLFVVSNDVIHLNKSTGWLRTEKQYTNFIFEAEWRALEPGYNSGFFLRAGLDGKPFPKDVWQVNLKESALGSLLKGPDTVSPSTTAKLPVNQWFKFRMEARGPKLFLDVNGERAWEFDHLDADHGYLGLQAEGRTFDFRNLRVQELP